jgi:hypothetical protein
METLLLSREEVARRARELYEKLRGEVETPENIGKLVILDVESGDYEIDDETSSEPSRRLQGRHPGGRLFALRIGYKTAVSFCGALERLEPTAP